MHSGGLVAYAACRKLIPFELADAVLEETRAREQRLRELPSRVGVYFVLALGLFPGFPHPQQGLRARRVPPGAEHGLRRDGGFDAAAFLEAVAATKAQFLEAASLSLYGWMTAVTPPLTGNPSDPAIARS